MITILYKNPKDGQLKDKGACVDSLNACLGRESRKRYIPITILLIHVLPSQATGVYVSIALVQINLMDIMWVWVQRVRVYLGIDLMHARARIWKIRLEPPTAFILLTCAIQASSRMIIQPNKRFWMRLLTVKITRYSGK